MDEIGELDRVLDEKHGDVVADNVPIAFPRVNLDCKAAHVASEVERALAPGDRGEANEGWRLLTDVTKDIGAGHALQAVGQFEIAVGAIAARMNDALGDALMGEMENLLTKMEVIDQRRPRAP